MSASIVTLQVLTYAAALWLGLYLLARDPAKVRLRLTGLGLAAYALALATDLLETTSSAVPADGWQQAGQLLTLVSALTWTGALLSFLPETSTLRQRLWRLWTYAWMPVVLIVFVVASIFGWLQPDEGNNVTVPQLLFAGIILLPLFAGLLLLIRSKPAPRRQATVGVLVVATIFFGLQIGWLFAPFAPVAPTLLLLGIGLDLFLLGMAIALLDAFEQGEAIRRDMARSFVGSFLAAALFGGQVALVIFLRGELSFALLALLLSIIAVAVGAQTFSETMQALLDILTFGSNSQLVATRASFRAAAQDASRLHDELRVEELDEETLVRLTRRALSHFGDLPRLSSSPLTRLAFIDRRLAARGLKGDTLERAAELKAVLTESIARLKPRGEKAFGAGDEWRHYNALYFPYVAGLKPYSRRAIHENLDEAQQEALAWFRHSVPERTLYNWQSAAAELVARDLKERALRAAS